MNITNKLQINKIMYSHLIKLKKKLMSLKIILNNLEDNQINKLIKFLLANKFKFKNKDKNNKI